MFLSALGTGIIVSLIAIIAAQYAFAVFCLLKLAYIDITKREYVLWNVFILIAFFIGGIAFLVYYYKVGKNKRIPEPTDTVEDADENGEGTEPPEAAAPDDTDGAGAEPDEVGETEQDGDEKEL